jgi:hypothetical protein
MKLHLGLNILISLILGFGPVAAMALEEEYVDDSVTEEPMVEVAPETYANTPLVEVELPRDTLLPYMQRRDNHGFYFGIDYEGVDLRNYVSVLDNTNQSYRDIYGENTVALIRLSFDYKYNTAIGSFAAGVDYGMGSLEGTKTGTTHTLNLARYGIGFKWTLDTLWDEPYVAPYAGINIWEMSIKESTTTDSFEMTTGYGYNYTLGFLFQLDWIDYDAAKSSTFNWGLENTFLDLYTTQYAKTASNTDPNTETDFIYGAGLRMEF